MCQMLIINIIPDKNTADTDYIVMLYTFRLMSLEAAVADLTNDFK